jgi:hypothetical protein
MKIAVERDYKQIYNSKLNDINEIEEIIKIAIMNGLDIQSLSENRLLELFLPLPIQTCANYLNDTQLKLIAEGKEFYKSNDEISNTLNPNFLSITTKEKFTDIQIEILSCYPKLQEEIIKLNLNQDNIKAKIIYKVASEYKENMEWITVLEKIIDNMNNSNFSNLFNDIENINLSDKDYKNLLHLLISNNNLDISSYDELRNYGIHRNIANIIFGNVVACVLESRDKETDPVKFETRQLLNVLHQNSPNIFQYLNYYQMQEIRIDEIFSDIIEAVRKETGEVLTPSSSPDI